MKNPRFEIILIKSQNGVVARNYSTTFQDKGVEGTRYVFLVWHVHRNFRLPEACKHASSLLTNAPISNVLNQLFPPPAQLINLLLEPTRSEFRSSGGQKFSVNIHFEPLSCKARGR